MTSYVQGDFAAAEQISSDMSLTAPRMSRAVFLGVTRLLNGRSWTPCAGEPGGPDRGGTCAARAAITSPWRRPSRAGEEGRAAVVPAPTRRSRRPPPGHRRRIAQALNPIEGDETRSGHGGVGSALRGGHADWEQTRPLGKRANFLSARLFAVPASREQALAKRAR